MTSAVPTRAHGERGDTLVEVLMAVAILGIAFTGILAGLATAARLSGTHRGLANADVVLVSAADAVKATGYVACPGNPTSAYLTAAQGVTKPANWLNSAIAIPVPIQYWNNGAFQSTCPATDQALQLITIKVTAPNGAAEQVDVVKRAPT